MKIITLDVQNCVLKLLIYENNWCSVFLLKNRQIIALGADHFRIVTQKFLKILDTENFPESRQKIKNSQRDPALKRRGFLELREYFNFINLSEKHTSGYAKITSEGVKIIWQNGINLDVIAILFLSLEECIQWKNILNHNF